MKFLIVFLFTIVSLAGYAQHLPKVQHKLVVIAHRGNHTAAPENTIQSVKDAIKVGVDYVEIDLRTTKDGALVIMHDGTVDRMTNGKGKVSELTFAEISKLQVREKSHPEFGTHSIPTFREVLEACKDKINIYLDFKDADIRKTWKEIQAAGMENSVVVYINAEPQYAAWRTVAPNVPLMVSLPEEITNEKSLEAFLKKADAEVLDGSYEQYTQSMVDLAVKKKRAVWVDIQQPGENPTLWEKALATGFQGLQTDHPQQLTEYLQAAGKR